MEDKVDELETCTIIKHKKDKKDKKGEVRVEVKWDDSRKTD